MGLRQETFLDYEGFCDKFRPVKTTDDCYTPDNVYNVVRDWAAAERAAAERAAAERAAAERAAAERAAAICWELSPRERELQRMLARSGK